MVNVSIQREGNGTCAVLAYDSGYRFQGRTFPDTKRPGESFERAQYDALDWLKKLRQAGLKADLAEDVVRS